MAWEEFIINKKKKLDVIRFEGNLMDNIISLHEDLANRTYRHGGYEAFKISDPKPRDIHKASVRDRLLHHAIYRVLYPFFDRSFMSDSYSCRIGKGTHKAVKRFNQMAMSESRNNHRTCWVLKCDIRKFFASIDHGVLLGLLAEYIPDENILWLLENVIESFSVSSRAKPRDPSGVSEVIPCLSAGRLRSAFDLGRNDTDKIGLPLGNLTSQLFANIYLNELDQWVKHNLRVKNYIRYADDFVFMSTDKNNLENLIPQIDNFLQSRLKLHLHNKKVFIQTYASGVDFLGWINYPTHRVLRRATKRRMFARVKENPQKETVQSYLGLLKHGNTEKLRRELLMGYWVLTT